MRKRHINEFIKTSFADSGRAKGTGIIEDNYGHDSWPDTRPEHSGCGRPKFEHRRRGEDGEVIVMKASEVE